jgi:hypothetical protein
MYVQSECECHFCGVSKTRIIKTYQKAFGQCHTLESIQYSLISLNLMHLKAIKKPFPLCFLFWRCGWNLEDI